MDINELRSIVTVVSLLTFLGYRLVGVWSKGQQGTLRGSGHAAIHR
jgi:hypothetical protein